MCEVLTIFLELFVNHADKWISDKFNDIVGVEEEMTKLCSRLRRILAELEMAGGREKHDAFLSDRLKKLEHVVFDAQDVLDTHETEVALWRINRKASRLRKPCFRSKLATKIKKIFKTLQTIDEETETSDQSKEPGESSGKRNQNSEKEEEFRERDSSSVTRQDDFVGRKDIKERLISQMISKRHVEGTSSTNTFPIIGMPGLGKTSLAQQIYNDEKIKKHFGEARMWTNVTVDFDYKNFLATLSSFLKEKGKCDFFLALDDVQEIGYDQLTQLKKLLEENCSTSIVLVTTQSRNLARKFLDKEPSPEFDLPELPEEECMELFRRVASPTGLPMNLEKYARKIITKCGRLPLAVKAIAWALKGNFDESKWKDILDAELWKLEQGTGTLNKPNVLPALRLAYSHLPYIIKQCFAYCSIFQKGYAFEKEELVKLWMAEPFIDPSKSEKYEATATQYFDELLERSFFQEVSIDNKVRYKLHDLMHELAQSVSSRQRCQVKDHSSCNFSDELLHVFLPSQDVEEHVENIAAKSKRLRTLLWPGAFLKDLGKALDKIFKTLEYIRVLDLSSSSLEKLPKSVKKLKLLRYLDLSNTKIRVLPDSICNLYNLQTLKLLGCVWLLELPKDLGKLVNLRHLELDDIFWYHCTKLPPNMGKMTGLHNLHVFPVSASGSGHGIEELKNMGYLTGNLHISKLENAVNAAECKLSEKGKLKKVVLEWSKEFVHQQDEVAVRDLLEDLRPHSDLKELEIHHFKGFSFPSWLIGGYLKNLVTLSLNHCTKCKTLSLGQLNQLSYLYIKGMLDLEEWREDGECTSVLQTLKISNCPKLRMLPCSMPYLCSLKIKNCHLLKALPSTLSMGFLILIDNLVLEDVQETTLRLFSHVKIINCPRISALPKGSFLLKLEIGRCELLTDLIDSHFLVRLRHLALDTCSNAKLLMKMPQNSSLKSLVVSSVSNLPSLPKELHLPSLETLYISNCKELTSLSEEGGSLRIFPSLKLLSVRGCPGLKSLPDDLPTALECLIIGSCHLLKSLGSGHTLQSLPSLKDVYIEDCPLLMSFPEEGLPASLQHLLIQGCPQLTAKCQKEGAEWEKIQNVPDLEIDSINTSSAKDVPQKKSSSSCCYPLKLR